MNTSGQVGSILSPILVATVVARFSDWSAPLYLAGVLFLLGGGLLGVGRSDQGRFRLSDGRLTGDQEIRSLLASGSRTRPKGHHEDTMT